MVVDCRRLNKSTIKDPFPMPRIDDLFAKIGDCTIFSTLDLHSGYHQIPMNHKSEKLTGFTTPFGHYHYKVMPFGLCNAPATFSRYMQQSLGDIPNVYVYLDDVLIASPSKEQHMNDLRIVLQRIKDAKLVCKKKKCHFLQDTVEFLGHTISAKGISIIEEKTKAIKEYPMTNSIKTAQSFLRMVNYYRSFIQNCSAISKPIIQYISKKCEWGEKQTNAVKELKNLLSSAPVLVPFVPGNTYRLTTDASIVFIGGVLERMVNDKLKGVVGYYSKTVSDTQSGYAAGELELLAIISNLNHFRYYLHGHKFILRTDHISLLSYHSLKEPSKRDARWLDFLGEFDFKLEYIKGGNNVVADALSRPAEINVINQQDVCPISQLESITPTEWLPELSKDPWSAAVLVRLGIIVDPDISDENRTLFQKYLKKFKFAK
ncbi:hypothetical protein TBLA_0B06850 [Henningerozyma blattae CBS 6284]|uniref:Reverse transcriptase domain-containing protein n=1 Tax=Henningerozyma blattae (strain ATCC 34711 / CBS 6284 / DSM 70876 / NBRC 10599 / NRRL Y-10934 / UCD 77-7) TaxID=1071380 RepID=I2GZF3_HENB6|nr:hypothetical protein TBLA_0B06850 [Tetrapisispora blattae CBS 6284]CCH59505.1 hypothetical protein TBLA_0B06850 [Tetrapisispora blattae CBS 6284]